MTSYSAGQFAIRTEGLQKVFGKKTAVRNLSLTVNQGEIFGFLGPNGAGKSTSIKMLLGLVRPTGGEAWVLGAPCGNVEIRRRIGFLPESFRFSDWMTPAELLEFHGRLCGVPAAVLRQRIPALIDLVGLTPHRDKRLQAYSKGMLQRIGLAQALVHEPDLIFLDEPTSALDPMGRRLVRDVIRAQRDRGATVFLNSHLLSEIEITCDRVCFIREGEVIANHDLRSFNFGKTTVRASVRKLSAEGFAGIAQWGVVADRSGDFLTVHVTSTDAVPRLLRHFVDSGADVYEFTPQQMSLEEVFVSTMGEDRGF
jgi:ABC-2 type transport system ATP-binding protein